MPDDPPKVAQRKRHDHASGGIMMGVDHVQSRHVERLVATALVLLAALPAIMTFARASAPLIAAIIALLLGVAAALEGSWPIMRKQLKRFAIGPAGVLLFAGLVLMSLSLLWTPAPERALQHLLHIAGSLFVIGVIVTGIPKRYGDRLRGLMPLGVALAAILAILHFTTSGALNEALGASTEAYKLNRTAIALALFSPIVLVISWRRRQFVSAFVLGFLALVAIWMSESESAKLASVVMLGSAPIAFAAPRLLHSIAAIAVLLTLLGAPLYIGFVNNLIPQSVHDAVGYGSLTIRGEIWREFAGLIWQRPIFGFGLEASNVIGEVELTAGLSEAQRGFLSWGHPHNAAVQIWFEFGVAGALISASLLALLFRAMTRLQDRELAIATTTSLGVYTIAFVSHGAWQAWWICLVGLVAFAFMLQMISSDRPDTPEPDASRPESKDPRSAL